MTILKEVTLPNGVYYAPSVEIASQVEIDKIADYYSRKHSGMEIGTLGGPQQVAPSETVYVVAHGNAKGDFTKLSIGQLRSTLMRHGVSKDMHVVLAGCFTKKTAVGTLNSPSFTVNAEGYEGVLNVVETELRDLVNDETSGNSHAIRTDQLQSAWCDSIKTASAVLRELKGKVTNQNGLELKDFFDLYPPIKAVTALRPIVFGNATSGKGCRGTLQSWMQNASDTAWRNAFWPALFAAMSKLARDYDFIVRHPGDPGSDGSGKRALLAAAQQLDTIHSKIFIDAEMKQLAYQKSINQTLKAHTVPKHLQ